MLQIILLPAFLQAIFVKKRQPFKNAKHKTETTVFQQPENPNFRSIATKQENTREFKLRLIHHLEGPRQNISPIKRIDHARTETYSYLFV